MGCQAESRGQKRDLVSKEIKPAQVEFVNAGKTGNDKLPNKETHKPSLGCRWCGRERHHRQVYSSLESSNHNGWLDRPARDY